MHILQTGSPQDGKGELFYNIMKKLPECLSHVVIRISQTHMGSCSSYSMILRNNSRSAYLALKKRLPHTIQYGIIDGECMHLLCHFLDKNRGKFGNMNYLQLGPLHVISYLSVGYKGGIIS